MKEYKWPVCPIQGRQLLDVHEEDLFSDYRVCNTYRGGGGYDQLPQIIKNRGINSNTQLGEIGTQFVVQLHGCHLRCNYCYVTKDGIFGKYKKVSTEEILYWFNRAKVERCSGVFHLMGGAPALYLSKWSLILEDFPKDSIFHSDLLLSEYNYKLRELLDINLDNTIYAVNIKGTNDFNYRENTNKEPNWYMMWKNLDKVLKSGINFYITFTNPDEDLEEFKDMLEGRFGRDILDNSFVIDLVKYDAIKNENAW